jgi:GNAT superfamily N-acetyltransferase
LGIENWPTYRRVHEKVLGGGDVAQPVRRELSAREARTRLPSGILDAADVVECGISSELPGITLRRADVGDARAIGMVFDAAVRDGWTFLGELAQRPIFSAQHWDGFVADHAPPKALIVAADGAHGVVGFTADHSEVGEMFLLFVDPAHAGRGVGRVLLNVAYDVLRAAGRTEAFLFTEERNARARAVYAAAGYRPDGTFRESDFNGAALRELRLVKAL